MSKRSVVDIIIEEIGHILVGLPSLILILFLFLDKEIRSLDYDIELLCYLCIFFPLIPYITIHNRKLADWSLNFEVYIRAKERLYRKLTTREIWILIGYISGILVYILYLAMTCFIILYPVVSKLW